VAADSGERHLANVRQLTFGGENAEAYFSANGDYLTFQGRADPGGCDQQWTVRTADGGGLARVSPAPGKTTCGFFYGDDRRVLFGSTHDNERGCPPPPTRARATSGSWTSTTSTRPRAAAATCGASPATAPTRPRRW
jgi:hypothetical protein